MTNSQPRAVLIRHGETAWSRDRRHTGRTDIPLTPWGEAQAPALAPRLAGRHFAEVLVSPLSRATRTAELAGLSDVEITADLVEWDYGDFEGRTTSAIREDRPGWDLFTEGAPHGESIHQVADRVDRVIARIRAGIGRRGVRGPRPPAAGPGRPVAGRGPGVGPLPDPRPRLDQRPRLGARTGRHRALEHLSPVAPDPSRPPVGALGRQS